MSSSAESAARRSSSAPGKILLVGEYVVLDGAQAVVMAVDRRARAHVAAQPQELSPFLAAVRDLAAPDEAAVAARVVVDTSELADVSGVKLGLGSSAAATVCAAACALGTDDRARVHALAHRAHATAQAPRGSRGSGADIAASVHGGVLVVRKVDDDAPLAVTRTALPPGLTLLPVWTGAAADTAPLVARVRALRERDVGTYDRIAARLAGAAARLVDALGPTGDAARAVAALRSGGEAVAALGEAAGCALWTPAHDRVRAAVAATGAAVKPTGAGGGDIALVACESPEAAKLAGAQLTAIGMIPLDLRVTEDGVRLRIDAPPSGA